MSLQVYETQHSLIWLSIKMGMRGRCTPWWKRERKNQSNATFPLQSWINRTLHTNRNLTPINDAGDSVAYHHVDINARFTIIVDASYLKWKGKWNHCEECASRWQKLIGRNWVRHRIDIETAVEIKQFIATPKRAIKLIILMRKRLTTSGPSTPALETVAPNHWFDLVSICSFRSLKLFPAIKIHKN